LRGGCNAAILRLVTLAEAWRELGVEPGADAETVRRAYLRLIKTRKPEADPAGFQRARQAYEIARAGGEIEALAAAAGAAAGDHAGEARAAGGAAGDAHARPHTDGDGGDGDGEQEASPADVAFQGFMSAWNAVPPSADQRARLEIAREAVAVLATDPRAHWLLVTTLSRLGTDEALAEALRAGWANGWPEFLEALLVRLPARARREEVEAAFASASPSLRLAGAAACAGWDGARGAALVTELCRAATSDLGDAAGDRVRALPMPRILDVILALHAAGALDAAAEAQAALGKCLHDSGLELALAGGPLGGVFMLAEELAGLPRDFPQPLRAAFAGATRAGDLTSAFADAVAYVEHHGEAAVGGWIGRLKSSAPNVAAILEGATASDRARRAYQSRARLASLRYLILPALLIGGRYCLFESPSPPTVSYEPAREIERPPMGAVLPLAQEPGPPVDLAMVIAASDDLCGLDAPRNGQLVCADVEALVSALTARDCDEVPARLRALKRALGRSPTDLDARFLTRAELARWQACTSHGPAGGGDAGP
jgi:hypothetical protein